MRKISIILAVLVLTSPVWASVDITCTSVDTVVTVSYAVVGEPNKVRAFALNITVDGGAKIIDVNDNVSAYYYIYPGSIVITGNNVTDWGTAVADYNDLPGDTLPGVGTSGVTVEMGALYDPPRDNSPNAPPTGGVLLKFTVDKRPTRVTITENVSRGGVVLTNPALDTVVNAPPYDVPAPGPVCWTYPCFTRGDANGDCKLTAADVSILRAAWPGLKGKYNPCADFNKDGKITAPDVLALRANWPGLKGPGCKGVPGCP